MPFTSGVKFSTKIVLLGVSCVILTALALWLVVALESSQYSLNAQQKVEEITDANVNDILLSAYNLVQAQGESVQRQVDNNLNVARYVLQDTGKISLSTDKIAWAARNQLDQKTTEIHLPKMYIGDTWLGQNTSFATETLLVDRIVYLVGGTATVFQRMDKQGNMLRVATNVQTLDGKRAIGTYIPVSNPDGTFNPVIMTILQGKTYHGLAYVVNAWYLAAYDPIFDDSGEVIGMLFVGVKQENITALREAIQELRVGKTGTISILSGKGERRGTFVISPNNLNDDLNAWNWQDAEDKYPYREVITSAVKLNKREIESTKFLWQEKDGSITWKEALYTYYAPFDWVIVAEVNVSEMVEYQAALQTGRNNMLAMTGLISLLIAALIGLACFILSLTIVRPLLQLSKVAEKIASGDLSASVKIRNKDEIGQLAGSFNEMAAALNSLLSNEREQYQRLETTVHCYGEHMTRVSSGDLTSRIAMDGKSKDINDPLVLLGEQLNDTAASLQSMINQTRSAANDLATASQEILAAATQQAAGASEQSAAISQTTATVEQVKSIADQASHRVLEMQGVSQRTQEVSRNGQKAVSDIIESMQQIRQRVVNIAQNISALSEQTRQIGEIISTVNEIAAQSNLLALNASVEAARAGEHGKAFAVVAGEVRSLAEQSRKATEQVRTILSKIQAATEATVVVTEQGTKGVEQGMQMAAQARSSIEQLSKVIDESTQIANQIAGGTQQQLAGMEQISTAMQNINQATVQGLASTRQAQASAENLLDLAKSMAGNVGQYRA